MVKKKILVICPHPVGVAPGQRLKYEQYFDYFEQNGFDITVSPFMTERFQKVVYKKGHVIEKGFWTIFGYFRRIFDLFRLPLYDGVYIFLWVAPFGPPIFEWLYAKFNSNYIYDIDDLVFLKPKSKFNPIISFLKSRNNSIYLMKKAKHVITCTPYLDKFVRNYNTSTTDISSTINTYKYCAKVSYDFKEHKPILGWSGSFSTSKYLHLLTDVFRRLREKYDFKILVMGDDKFHIDGLDIEAIPWKEEHEVSTIARFDIGLYPLPNEEWVLGKSGLKALQYMSLGIPTVATAIGANHRVIDNGISGFLVNTKEEWLQRLTLLLENQQIREDIGKAAAVRVENKYSINANRSTYVGIFKEVYN